MAVVIDFGGRSYFADNVQDVGAFPDSLDNDTFGIGATTNILTGFYDAGLANIAYVNDDNTLDFSADLMPDSGGPPSYPFSSILADTALVWEDGTPYLRSSDYIATGGLSPAEFSYDIVVPTDFTRQFNSFYADWNQRNVSTVIEGSVTNIISGVTEATAAAVTESATAIQFVLPTIDIGDIATTALGAVNTGDITAGVNSAIDEASTSTTRAIRASMVVVGGSAETGTMMLNVAHNTSAIRANVENILTAVNGSMGDVATTALGAVNTGSIVSGLNAAVNGIVGISGQ